MRFKYPVYIPTTRGYINITELTNNHYGTLVKYIANNDAPGLESAFNELISELTGVSHGKFNKIDKFCILLTARIMCVGPELPLEFKCSKTEQKYKGAVDLNHVLQLISDLSIHKPKNIHIKKNIQIKIGTPVSFYIPNDDILDAFTDAIYEITISNQQFDLTSTTIEEKNKVFDRLAGVDFSTILKSTTVFQRSFKDIVVFSDKNPHDEDAEIVDYKLGLYDNTMFDFIRLTFTSNLQSYYNTIYALCDSMGFTADYANSITPVEASIYIQNKAQEIEKQNQAQKQKQPQSVGGLPAPPMAF